MHSFIEAAQRIYKEAKKEGRLKEGLSIEEIKLIAERQDGVIKTQFGSLAADSEPMSRSAPHTKNSVDYEFGEEEDLLAEEDVNALKSEKLISMDSMVGDGKEGITVRFIVPEKHAQIAYGLKLLFGEPEKRVVERPTYHIIFFTTDSFELNKSKNLKEKDVVVRLYMGEKIGEQVKICKNTTYTGEGKKGVFMFEDWRVKALSKTGLFLHMGVRRDYLWKYSQEKKEFEIIPIVTGISGLTATGKTVTAARSLARFPGEVSELVQDDGGEFKFDSSFSGFESKGIYIKTDGISPDDQPEVYSAAIKKDAFLENISLRRYPYIPDFKETSKTTNGRAIITRKNMEISSENIRAEKVDNIILLTRNPLVNVISKLTPEQAVMQFIYGESIESSGGDPSKAGQFKREFFLDPFVAGNFLEHALIFYKILKKNPGISCYLSNTGTIGQEQRIKDEELYKNVVNKDPKTQEYYSNLGMEIEVDKERKEVVLKKSITLLQSLSAYSDILRGQIKFSSHGDHLGYRYPVKSDRLGRSSSIAANFFPDKQLLKEQVADFLEGRRKYMEAFEKKYGAIPKNIKESLPPFSDDV